MPDVNSTIEWSAIGEILQGIGAILGALAIGVAAWIGSNTFKSWREQKLSERRIEQAERILTATYKARRGLSHVRNPAIWSHELNAAEASLKASGEWDSIVGGELEQKRFATAQVYYNRLNRTRDERRALEECQPMARALFGEELEQAIETLNGQFWIVQVSVNANYNRDSSVGDAAFQRKIDAAIYENYPSHKDNEIDQTIAVQVKMIEDICVPVLRLEGRNRKN